MFRYRIDGPDLASFSNWLRLNWWDFTLTAKDGSLLLVAGEEPVWLPNSVRHDSYPMRWNNEVTPPQLVALDTVDPLLRCHVSDPLPNRLDFVVSRRDVLEILRYWEQTFSWQNFFSNEDERCHFLKPLVESAPDLDAQLEGWIRTKLDLTHQFFDMTEVSESPVFLSAVMQTTNRNGSGQADPENAASTGDVPGIGEEGANEGQREPTGDLSGRHFAMEGKRMAYVTHDNYSFKAHRFEVYECIMRNRHAFRPLEQEQRWGSDVWRGRVVHLMYPFPIDQSIVYVRVWPAAEDTDDCPEWARTPVGLIKLEETQPGITVATLGITDDEFEGDIEQVTVADLGRITSKTELTEWWFEMIPQWVARLDSRKAGSGQVPAPNGNGLLAKNAQMTNQEPTDCPGDTEIRQTETQGQSGEPDRNNLEQAAGTGPTEKTRLRALAFKKIKEAHPEWGRDRVAIEACDELGETVGAETVRNAYRAMGWEWKRGDRVR